MNSLDGRLTLAQHEQLRDLFSLSAKEKVDLYVACLAEARRAEAAVQSVKDELLRDSCRDHDGADEMYRKGAVLCGTNAKVQAVWRMVGDYPRHSWEPRLEFVKPK